MAIQIIPENKRRSLGQELAGGLAQGLPQAFERYQDYQRMLNENDALKKQYGVDLAGITNPETRKALLADQLKFGRAMKEQKASAQLPETRGGREENELTPAYTKKELPEFGNFKQRPSSVNGAKAQKQVNEPPLEKTIEFEPLDQAEVTQPAGQRPQTETYGGKYQKRSLEQRERDANKNLEEKTARGIQTDKEHELALIDQEENYKDKYNLGIDTDLQNRVNFQTRYGNYVDSYIDKIQKANPEDPIASPKIRAIVKGTAEKYAGENISEAKIQEAIAKEVEQISDMFHDLDDAIPMANVWGKVSRSLQGKDRGQKAIEDVKTKIKPLLKLGLYDEVREKLYAKRIRPELAESFIGDLNENSQKVVGELPSFKSKTSLFKPIKNAGTPGIETPVELSPAQREQFESNFNRVLQEDPKTNLILLRKAYMDKGLGYEDFWDALSKKMNDGTFTPTPDQRRMLNRLSEPPLDGLDRLLTIFGEANLL